MGSMSLIEGNDLVLRHITMNDFEDFSNLLTNPLYGKYSPLGKLSSEMALQTLQGIVDHYNQDQDKDNQDSDEFWVVIDKEENKIAGFVGNHPIIFDNKTNEMFFAGFYTRYWGGKFPEIASQFACNYAFYGKGISKLLVFVHPDDTSSLMCAQILDAKFEKEVSFFGANFFLFSLAKENFKKIDAVKLNQ